MAICCNPLNGSSPYSFSEVRVSDADTVTVRFQGGEEAMISFWAWRVPPVYLRIFSAICLGIYIYILYLIFPWF